MPENDDVSLDVAQSKFIILPQTVDEAHREVNRNTR